MGEWITNNFGTIVGVVGVITGLGSLWLAKNKDHRESEASDVSVRKGRLELAEMIEQVAERQVAKALTENETLRAEAETLRRDFTDLQAEVAKLQADRESDHVVRVIMLNHIREIHNWIADGSPPPPPVLPASIAPLLWEYS